jgi:hypothetical protein
MERCQGFEPQGTNPRPAVQRAVILPLNRTGVGQAGVEPAAASRGISPALSPLSYWPVGTPGVEPGGYRFIRTASSPAESVPWSGWRESRTPKAALAARRFSGPLPSPVGLPIPGRKAEHSKPMPGGTLRLATGPGASPVHLPRVAPLGFEPRRPVSETGGSTSWPRGSASG